MPTADTVLTALTVTAGLSLAVERALELLKQLMDYGNGSLSPEEQKKSVDRAKKLIEAADRAVAEAETGTAGAKAPRAAVQAGTRPKEPPAGMATDAEPSEKYPPPAIPLVRMTAPSAQATARTLFLHFAAAGLGIILASVFQLRLVSLLAGGTHPFWDILFTGLVIGGSSQPIHVLITFITERKITPIEGSTGEATEKEVEKVKTLAKVISAGAFVAEKKEPQALAWVDIPYAGGVYPERLEDQHRRPSQPDLVIYHHTAMSSASTFQTVVDEFLVNKKWLTGYNCVVMPDGAIKPFCRWDRYGNHALELNGRSLGLAFHGNFETRPGEYSNADGRFGNQAPTEAQLHAGARVVTLWLYLYRIEPSFSTGVLSHKAAMPGHTDCPGSSFPYDPFETLVHQYHDAWSHSDAALRGIEAFRRLPYVYAEPRLPVGGRPQPAPAPVPPAPVPAAAPDVRGVPTR